MAEDKKYFIGCSGYYYGSWKERFYPKGLAPKNWLRHYSSIFNTVELNGTFYSTPRLSTLQNYASQTPEDFRFSAKMSKYISHILRLKNATEPVENYQRLFIDGLEEKLACALFQMPPSFHYNAENLQRVLEHVPRSPWNVIEFRHFSWWNKTVEQELTKAKITFCNVDFPGLESHIVQTSDIFYFRFHGNPELFKSFYSDPTLKKFQREFPTDCREYYIYFNNTYYDAAYRNAQTLMSMINEPMERSKVFV